MKPVALYARVSTADQNLEPQLHALREHAQRVGAESVEFVDHGISGAKDRRPGLDAMMDACRRGEASAVVVVKLDRLGRSLHHLLTLLGELEALGIDLVSLDDGLDTSTAVGRLFFQVRAAFSEYERALIVERVRAGIAAARRRGQKLGRPPVLDRQALDRARRLRKSGHSIRSIAKLLDAKPSTVHKHLKHS